MDKKDYEMGTAGKASLPTGVTSPADAGEAKSLDYFREARLFLGKDRATLTFYVDQEVASIHYDTNRDEIFYRGHNVKNMTMTQEQWQSLQKFAEYLADDPRAELLLQSYRTCLEHLMSHHDLPA